MENELGEEEAAHPIAVHRSKFCTRGRGDQGQASRAWGRRFHRGLGGGRGTFPSLLLERAHRRLLLAATLN